MTSSARPSPRLRFRIPLLLAILTLHAVLAGFERGDLIDDAYISARYARNLVQGYGLVYNRGVGLTRVEGYSNFLWVLILAVGHAAGATLRTITQTAGIAANLLTLLLVWLLVRRLRRRPEPDSTDDHYLDLAAPLLLAVNLPFLIWASAGLETSLFALEIILTFILWGNGQGPKYPALATAWLAALTRPEGVLLFIALVLARTAELVRNRERLLKSDVNNLLAFLVPYFVYFLWRFFYYGHSVFPNSYYAKVDPGRTALKEGIFYLYSWFEWGSLPFLLLLGFGVYRLSPRRDRHLLAPHIIHGHNLRFKL
jgi:arabinofuranosyltransferase